MKIDISKDWEIDIISDLYNAGMTEDGESYEAEVFFVVAMRKDGKVLVHEKTYKGVETEFNDEVGCLFFGDVREEVLKEANTLVSRIKSVGVIDSTYWVEREPSYGSEYYCKKYNF